MSDKEQAKEKLKNLVADFKNNPNYYKKLSEADVEDKLVNELFVNILGWDKKDYEKRAKVRRGDKGGSADYAFKINDRIVFFLEVKKVTIPLDKEADEQVILYSLSKKVPLAISTNFQQMNIFCVEQENAIQNVFRNFKTPDDYVNNFQDLLFLSKESFEQGLLLKKAEDEGRLKRRVSIDKVLLEDFWRVRTLIANDIEKNKPGKYNINEKDEIVQRILDRLIFIRRCEDIGINPENLTLVEIKHVAESRAYSQLKALFTKYDSVYNSGLFTPNKDNDCDIITIDGSIIQKLISYLYESHDKKYKYNFEWIDADVLGQVYEQYLGKILAQTKSGKAKLKEGQAHRKEQGIYYTPTYIVDYIVKNTLGELLKDKKVDAQKIKILDPACGSGSFLIKAFDYMQQHLSQNEEAKQHKLDFQGSYSVKTEILKNNIFGVDLDNKAVEITKLNLLLKAAEKFRKLPKELDNHIGWGNSLIDDDAFEHPFKWVGDFQEGTFDVVIGNPPWGADIDDILGYLKEKYLQSTQEHKDIYKCFIEKAMNLLKNGGVFGFIVPNTCLLQPRYKDIRIFLKKYTIIKIVNLGEKVFEGVEAPSCIIIVQKKKADGKNKVKIIDLANSKNNDFKANALSSPKYIELPQSVYDKTVDNNFVTFYRELKNGEKLLEGVMECKDCGIKYQRVAVGMKEKGKNNLFERLFYEGEQNNKQDKNYIIGADLNRYFIDFKKNRWMKSNYKNILKNNEIVYFNENYFNAKEKILWRQTASRPICSLAGPYWFANTLQVGVLKDEFKREINIKYLLALLNSKFFSYLYIQSVRELGRVFPQVKLNKIKQLPVKIISLEKQQPLIKLVDRMLSLNKQLQEIGDKKTAQTAKLEAEIKKTDQEIDELVYKLYGITEEEKKIIEESLR